MKGVAIIDADVLVYQMAHRAQSNVDWGEDEPCADLAHARDGIKEAVEQCLDDTDSDREIMCLTPAGSLFRHDVYPDYKQQRRAAERPALYWPLREWVETNWPCVQRARLEADDVMGILATSKTALIPGDEPRTICTVDKDLRTIPGRHYNWRKPSLGVEFVREGEADLAFYCQALQGDMTDNYPGCPSIGTKRARRALGEFHQPWGGDDLDDLFDEVGAWERIVETYSFNMPFTWEGDSRTVPPMEEVEEYALTMARCARILRGCDYNSKTGTVKLWEPPVA